MHINAINIPIILANVYVFLGANPIDAVLCIICGNIVTIYTARIK